MGVGRVIALTLSFLFLASFGAKDAEDQATEYQLKAAFLNNFTKFITWPEDSFEDKKSPLVVAVVGKDPFGKLLDLTFKNGRAGDRKIEVKRFARAEDVGVCHILFVPQGETKNLAAIKKKIGKQNVLIVGESNRFAQTGGIVNFYLESSKLRFAINKKEADALGLKISSQLLKLARIVESDPDSSRGGDE